MEKYDINHYPSDTNDLISILNITNENFKLNDTITINYHFLEHYEQAEKTREIRLFSNNH